MKNRKIIVVGGGSGIGAGIVQAAHAAGAAVVVAGRTRAKLDAVIAGLPAGPEARPVAVDVTDEDSVARLFAETGPFDHLVSTVADLAYAPIREFAVADARRSLDSKLISALLLAKHGAPVARAGGSLTFISGVAAERPMPGGAFVAAANGALASLAAAMALELAPLRVNVVSPGWVDTPIWDGMFGDRKDKLQATMAAKLPVRRIGRPEDVAQAVLAVMANGFMTGTVVHVDGGHRLV